MAGGSRSPFLRLTRDHRLPGPPGELARYEAVRLFVERSRLRSPHFELRSENARAVAQICRKLEGIPLAIELAAARVRGALRGADLREARGRPEALDERRPDAERRVIGRCRATLEWSYELLAEAEQKAVRAALGVRRGLDLKAAEAVAGGRAVEEADVTGAALGAGGQVAGRSEPRGGRAYATGCWSRSGSTPRESLEESGEAEAVRRRHAEFFLALAEEAAAGVVGSGSARSGSKRLEAEHDNLRAALSWSLEKEPERALRLAGTLARFWEMRCPLSEGSEWLEAALRQGDRVDAPTRAKLLSEAGTFAFYRAHFDHAIELHGEASNLPGSGGRQRRCLRAAVPGGSILRKERLRERVAVLGRRR